MKILKPIISVFLLLTYLVGFSHNILPHHHFDEAQPYTHLEMHEHANVNEYDYDDVKHKSHLDDSFIDYVLCLLSEVKHPTSYKVDKHMVSFQKEANSLKEKFIVSFLSLVFSFNPDSSAQPTIIKPNNRVVFLGSPIPFIESFSFRGPPSISC